MKSGDVYRIDRRFPVKDTLPRPGDITLYKVIKVRTKYVDFEVRENEGRAPVRTVRMEHRIANWIASRHLRG